MKRTGYRRLLRHLSQVSTVDTAYFTHYTSKQSGHNCTQIYCKRRPATQYSSCSHAIPPTFNTNCVYVRYPYRLAVSASGSPTFIHSTLTIPYTQFTLSPCFAATHSSTPNAATTPHMRGQDKHTHAGMRKNIHENGNWTEICVWPILFQQTGGRPVNRSHLPTTNLNNAISKTGERLISIRRISFYWAQ